MKYTDTVSNQLIRVEFECILLAKPKVLCLSNCIVDIGFMMTIVSSNPSLYVALFDSVI